MKLLFIRFSICFITIWVQEVHQQHKQERKNGRLQAQPISKEFKVTIGHDSGYNQKHSP